MQPRIDCSGSRSYSSSAGCMLIMMMMILWRMHGGCVVDGISPGHKTANSSTVK